MFGDAVDTRKLPEIGASPFVPVPGADLIRKIAGADITADEYRRSGLILAADIYNQFVAARGGPRGITIVDLGCGPGRVASFLGQLFRDCDYLGVDVQGEMIGWASAALSTAVPNLKFRRVGSETDYAGSKSFEVPVTAETIELVVAASLFTHLDEAGAIGYFREIRRMLQHDGVGYLTYFSFDDEEAQSFARVAAERNSHVLTQSGKCWYWGSHGIFDTFYREEDLHLLAADAGLRIANIRRGWWARTQRPTDETAAFQDLMIVRRADFPSVLV